MNFLPLAASNPTEGLVKVRVSQQIDAGKCYQVTNNEEAYLYGQH
jgi:hypothetical protein